MGIFKRKISGNSQESRLLWADLLKIIAVYAVILIHTSAPFLLELKTRGLYYWWAGNFYDSLSRWSIPVFVMLSGLFLIDRFREDSIKDFFARRFMRVFVPLILWSFVYFLWRIHANNEALPLSSFIPMLFIEPIYYHLWFLYLVLGLYLLTPIISLYMKNSPIRHAWFYLAVWFLIASMLPFIESWAGVTTYMSVGDGNSIFKFSGYFVLGWLLRGTELSPAKRAFVCLLFLIGFFITAYGTYMATAIRNNGELSEVFYEYFSHSVFLMAISIFLLAKNFRLEALSSNSRKNNAIAFIGACVPGIYLIHALLLGAAKKGLLGMKFTPEMMDPFIGIPIFALAVFIASLLIIAAIKLIPIIKYAVPAILIFSFLSAINAQARPLKLIKKDEFKTLTGFSRTHFKKLPELEAWKSAVPQAKVVSIRSTYDKTVQKAIFHDSGSPEKKPLLIVLHSWSEDYRQSFGIPYGVWAVENDWVFIQPDYRGPFTNPKATASDAALNDILDALDYAKRHAKVDETRVYLAGFSGGGMAALVMAGKYPEIWAGVASWGAVYDLADWYAHTRNARHGYSSQIAASCGGPPIPGTAQEKECRKRSPSKYLANAKGKVAVYIAAGSRDSFVPPSHSMRAFNDIADGDKFPDEEMEYISKNKRLPLNLVGDYSDKLFENAGVKFLYERTSGSSVLKIYEGSHDVVYNACLSWLAEQKRQIAGIN